MTLHVYAQTNQNDDAYIVGTRNELAKLGLAINRALGNQSLGRSSDEVEAFVASDGEGYDLYVKVVPASVEKKLVLPYTVAIEAALDGGGWTPDLVPTD